MGKEIQKSVIPANLLTDLKLIIRQARQGAYAAVNACMISAYWKIGQRIVEEEQHGNARAEYGKGLIEKLADSLTAEFGSNFNARNLAYYKKILPLFPGNIDFERTRSKSYVDSFQVTFAGAGCRGSLMVS